tara:strand:- start:143 stop:1363 length:1221 start_codon:yes stop_codon:yes gene_type:complete
MIKKKSPFYPKLFESFHEIEGVNVASTSCGLKKNKKDDLVLIKFDRSCDIISYLTTSKTPGEPVKWNKKIRRIHKVSIILINSGNANVFTGREGARSIERIINYLSKTLNLKKNEIYLASTGVIGEPLDEKKIIKSLPNLLRNLSNSKSSWFEAANAITTTDTFPKIKSIAYKKNNKQIIINGFAKGSGMIEPNMATMLAFIFTNFKIDLRKDKKAMKNILNQTFNSISVDGEMSTSDMVLIVSNISNNYNYERSKKKFLGNIRNLMLDLAKQIVKDGEGCSKFISITVRNANKKKDAIEISKKIANSVLFKTAMFGCDSNWGRIIMAIGKGSIKIPEKKISISFGPYKIIKNGKICHLNEKTIKKYLSKKEIKLDIDLSSGKECNEVWTTDLTNEYININSDYRS